MFDRMRYVLVVPEEMARSSMLYLPKLKNQFLIGDLDGNVLGNITETIGHKTLHTFEDDRGNKLGHTSIESKMGFQTGRILIYDSMNELRGKIKSGLVYRNKIIGFKSTTIPVHTLEDASGHQIAITDSFKFKIPWGYIECVFENRRTEGLNIRSPDGNIVAILKASSSINAIQIDLSSPTIDQLLIFSLIITVIL